MTPGSELPQKPELPPLGPPVSSSHCQGPGGLEGWKLLYRLPDSPYDSPDRAGRLALGIEVRRKGRFVRRIYGNPVIWDWYFVDERRVAFESGPLHFGMECDLVDVDSGKLVAHYNCYHHPPKDPPQWVQTLENGGSVCGDGKS